MKGLLACVLLLLLPLSGVRLVCVELHADGDGKRARAMIAAEDAAAAERECERVCTRHPGAHPPAPPPASTAGVSCVLIPDPGCTFLASVGIAILPAPVVTPGAPAVHPFETSATAGYLPPLLPHRGPPPRA